MGTALYGADGAGNADYAPPYTGSYQLGIRPGHLEGRTYLYRTDFLVQPDAKVACWYGEKEGHMKKAIQRLRTAYPSLIVRCFPGFGHGEIINHPALLVSEMEHFLADGETVADAQQNQEKWKYNEKLQH